VTPEFATDPRFRVMNVRSTAVWAVAFMACAIVSMTLQGAVSTWLPLVVMAGAVIS
jgi:hypothetical protein